MPANVVAAALTAWHRAGVAADLRTLSPEDWELWRDVRLRALADSPDAFGSTLAREQAYVERDWRTLLEDGLMVVVLDADAPVACGGASVKAPHRAAIIAMWTDPAHRGRGHAPKVLDMLVGWASARGLGVELGVNRINEAARSVYRRYGFAPTGHCRPLREGSDQICDVWELGPRVSRG